MISITVSGNEENSDRPDALRRALEIARDSYPGIFGEIQVGNPFCDILFEGDGITVAIEVKTPADYVVSLQSGHLGKQLLTFIERRIPCFIVILGSRNDIDNCISYVNVHGKRSWESRNTERKMIRAFFTRAVASKINHLFLSNNPVESFIDVLDIVNNIAKCDDTWLYQWLPVENKANRQIAMLCMLPGVSGKTGKGLLEHFGSVKDMMLKLHNDPTCLKDVKINNRKLGERANKILEALSI